VVEDVKDEVQEPLKNNGAKKGKKNMTDSAQKKKRKGKSGRKRSKQKRRNR
jgi:hypothetical protein